MDTTGTSTAFAYLRVSGRGQLDGDGFPRQRAAITKYAGTNGLTVVKWFEERAVTGKSEWEDRAAWAEMVQSMNGTRTIVIERLDRLARDLMVQEHIIADLKRRGVTLVSVNEPDLGSDDPTRVLMRQIMGAIAQYDRAMIVLKLQGARARAKARDGRCEGRKPFGHYEGESAALSLIQAMAERGENAAAIARWLNEHGWKARSGGKWHPFTVGRILKRDGRAA